MAPLLRPNKYAYRAIVLVGLTAVKLFRVPLLASGEEHLPTDQVVHGLHREVLPGKGAVVAVTHFGYLDFVFAQLVVWRRLRAHPRFLITRKHTGSALVTAVCRLCDHVVVDRADGAPAYAEAVAKLAQGEFLAVFPEGGVSRSWTVRPLRTGAVRMAAETGAPVIPVSVWGSHRMLTRGRGGIRLRDVWRTPVRVHVGPELRVAPGEDVRAASARLRSALQEGIDRCIESYPAPPGPGAWWMPAHLGGSAITVQEQAESDEREREAYKRTG
ncbi:lysophospholipid acyltransferase family protein [Kocuria sp. M1N1S27]|uniref:lysophospholipid acyltransferase family protein n=1 Tax=Kocuria kalidii TaxID=3376283 RepID=UPI0037B1AB11